MNITVRVAEDHGRDRDHKDVTGWDVGHDGALWIYRSDGTEAIYAPGVWRWAERFPTVAPTQDAT